MNNRIFFLLTTLAVALSTGGVFAVTINVSPGDDWLAKIDSAMPGDVVQFASGTFSSFGESFARRRISNLNGTQANPIVIRGAGTRETTLTGGSNGFVFSLKDSSFVRIENFVITNPDSDGVDGSTQRVLLNAGPNEEGIIVTDSSNITLRMNRFEDIGTRGILTTWSTQDVLIENNIFANIGNNTAAADINLNGAGLQTVRGNLLAGNVDGVVYDGSGVGNIIERNIFVDHWQENAIDLKSVTASVSSPTTIRSNVIYGNKLARENAVHLQNSSKFILFENNIIRGMNPDGPARSGVLIHGRADDSGSPVSDIEISGNFFDGGFSNFKIAVNAITGRPPAAVQDILVNDNWYTADIATFLQPGPAINLQSNNNQLVVTTPFGLIGLENSIFTELEVYFSAQEITNALQGSGVSRISELIFADSFDDG